MFSALHISDTHLGKAPEETPQRRGDLLSNFEEGLEIAIEESVDCVIHTGDLGDGARLEEGIEQSVVALLKRLRQEDIEYLQLPGNHDSRSNTATLQTLSNKGLAQLLGKEPITVGQCAFYGVSDISNNNATGPGFFEPVPENTECTVLCGHGTFEEFAAKPAPTQPSAERLLTNINIQPNLVLMGHLHQKHAVKEFDGISVCYAGSTFGELDAGSERYVWVLNIDTSEREAKREPRKLSTRPHQTVRIRCDIGTTIPNVKQEVLEELSTVEGSVVKVTLHGDNAQINKKIIKERLEEKGIVHVSIADEGLNNPHDPNEYLFHTTGDDTEESINEALERAELAPETQTIVETISVTDAKSKIQQKVRSALAFDVTESDSE